MRLSGHNWASVRQAECPQPTAHTCLYTCLYLPTASSVSRLTAGGKTWRTQTQCRAQLSDFSIAFVLWVRKFAEISDLRKAQGFRVSCLWTIFPSAPSHWISDYCQTGTRKVLTWQQSVTGLTDPGSCFTCYNQTRLMSLSLLTQSRNGRKIIPNWTVPFLTSRERQHAINLEIIVVHNQQLKCNLEGII